MNNRLIMMDCCPKTGLLKNPRCEHSSVDLSPCPLIVGRGHNLVARIVPAKMVDGKLSGRVWDYLTDSEARQCRMAHEVRIADITTSTGRMVAHVAGNIRAYIKSRDLTITGIRMMHQISDGWWLRSSSTPLWSELGALMRALEKATKTPEGEIESPFYDPVGVE